MKTNIYLILSFGILSIAFSYENKFSYNNSGKIRLEQTPEIIERVDGYSRIVKVGEGHITEEGMPELPIFSTFYHLDPSKTYDFQLQVLDSYIIENITILPHQGMKKWDVDIVKEKNEEVYNSYLPFPETNIIVSKRIQGRGIQLVNLEVIPYTYYPKYHKLEVYTSIDIEVVETGVNSDSILHQVKRSHIFDELYKDFVVNFTYSEREDDYQDLSLLYIAGEDWLENDFVQDLLDWRHRQGYIVHAVSTSEIGATCSSNNNCNNEDEIKEYIESAYITWENPPEIVGLIGDTNVIDCFYQDWGTGGWNYYNGATDFDFTDMDGDGLTSEIIIGRISGQAQSTMENVVNKTIQYEKALYVDDDWFMRAALVGDPSESGNSTIFTSQYIENIMINHGMNDVQTKYTGSGISNWLIDQYQEGILYYNYRGIYGDSGTSPSNSYNNGYQTPFATVMTCGTGDFDEGNSQTEEFVKMGSVSQPEGAVAAIGLATTGTHTAYNNILDMGIYDGIFPKKLWYAGAAEINGDLSILATYPSNPNGVTEAFIAWSSLIGDPALHLWTDIPKNFAVDHLDDIVLGTTETDIIVYDENGETVEGARVTLLMGDDTIFSTGITDENGEISLHWDAVVAGEMYITVIKRNHRPYESTISISSSGVAIAISSEEILVESGQALDFNISLQNYGRFSAKGVVAELNSSSEYVTIGNAINLYGTIDPYSIVSESFPVIIHGIVYENEDLDFTLTIKDNIGNIWINHVPVKVSGPYIVFKNNSEPLVPGSTTNLSIEVENDGSTSIDNYMLEMLPYEDLLIVNFGIENFTNLFPEEKALLNDFNVTFNESIINGSIIPIEVLITSSDGHTRKNIIPIMVGEASETDPTGPDAYGYYIYDDRDVDYDLSPDYNWIEIAEGLGQKLEIYDNGNGNNYSGTYTYGSTVLDLPFIFTFYGIDYNQIVVNTNGWISFGDFEMYSFRNYPIPGAGGPSPMVAAFWDDLRTWSGGNVYHYEADNMVVIQWDDLRTYDNNMDFHETFQIILYSNEYTSETPTGDNEIKIQYEEFNNTSDGNYPDGGTPTHGCYSTIGIENHLGDDGLQYTFNNTYPETAATLDNGSAIFITTRIEIDSCSVDIGDVNGDNNVNILDIVQIVNLILDAGTPTYECAADSNGDGIVNILDIIEIINYIINP